jgi:hypothetical protein
MIVYITDLGRGRRTLAREVPPLQLAVEVQQPRADPEVRVRAQDPRGQLYLLRRAASRLGFGRIAILV